MGKKAILIVLILAFIALNFIVFNAVKVPYTERETYSEQELSSIDKIEARPAQYNLSFIGYGPTLVAGGSTRGDSYRLTNLEGSRLCFSYASVVMRNSYIECASNEEEEVCVDANRGAVFIVIASPACQERFKSHNKDIMSDDYMIKPVFSSIPNVEITSKESVYVPVDKTRTVTKYETLWQAMLRTIAG